LEGCGRLLVLNGESEGSSLERATEEKRLPIQWSSGNHRNRRNQKYARVSALPMSPFSPLKLGRDESSNLLGK